MRLINADALKDRLLKINSCAMRKNGMPINLIDGISIALGCLNDMKTIDAEPVVHGRWIRAAAYNDGIMNTVFCSRCKVFQIVGNWDYYPYCMHCGAKMDLEE